jgi:hypothetical protein
MELRLDGYVIDVLMRDLTAHERRASAFLVYLHLWRRTLGAGRKAAALSYQAIADGTGLSKSAVQGAVALLRRRRLVTATQAHRTATPVYRVERPWLRHGAPRSR